VTRAELEALAQSMGVPLEQAAAMLGESSLLRGPHPGKLHRPPTSAGGEVSMRGVHPPPIVPGKLG